MNLGILLAALLAVAGIAFAGGAWWSDGRAAGQLTRARTDTALCADQLAAKGEALALVRAQLAEQHERRERALAAADAALATRDAALATLHADAATRASALRNAAHEDPDIAALARLPVPAGVARWLWPAAAAPGAAAAH